MPRQPVGDDGFDEGDVVIDAVEFMVLNDVVGESSIARAGEDGAEEGPGPLLAIEALI